MKKKKLLFLTVHFDTGGTEKVTYDIIKNLDPNKYDITLMSMYGGGYFWDNLPEYVHKKYFFPRFIRFVIRYVTTFPASMVYRTFIHEKYDVEIACGDDIPSRIIGHSPNKNSKKIAWIHMDVIERGYQGYEIKTERGRKKFYSNFDSIVNVSKDCEKKFIQKFGSELPTCVIYNPIDADEIRKKADAEPGLILPRDRFNIVSIGRFTPQKGFDRLIQAYYELKQCGIKPTRITILGDGYESELYARMITELNLENDIILAGYFNNPYSILKQADLFLLSSRDESFSLVTAEAMVLGIPVMSTRCVGPVELLKNGAAGYLVENSMEGIREGMRDILTSSETYEKYFQIAAANTNNFDLAKQMQIIDNLIYNDD